MSKILKNERAITLIALIITVIIMLILAGVAISMLTGGEGLFEKTQLAADTYGKATQNEIEQITSLMNEIDIYLDGLPQPSAKYPNGTWTGTVNEPKIEGTGLIPVKFDATGVPTELTPEQAKNTVWYDYKEQEGTTENGGTSEWANAITKNEQGEITGYFVWIPRYEYKITYNNNADKSQGGSIDINFISTDTTTPTSGYTIHPAFTDESATTPVYKNGGWKEEIPGFWVAKFEAGFAGGDMNDSNNDVTIADSSLAYTGNYDNITNYYGPITSDTTTMKLPVFLPKTYVYNNINIGDSFNLSRKIQNAITYYGLNNTKVDSHMMKNSEWGAVAYLAHSKYGRNGTEITINNVNMNNMVSNISPITGYSGNDVNASVNSLSNAPVGDVLGDMLGLTSYAWNTTNGVLAGSTGNVYGIFDLSGGSWERVAGYIPVQNSSKYINKYGGTFSKNGDDNIKTTSTEHASLYAVSDDGSGRSANYSVSMNTERKGEAIWELSTNGNHSGGSWNGDRSYFLFTDVPFFYRGGHYSNGVAAGVFAFGGSTGEVTALTGFRAVVTPL